MSAPGRSTERPSLRPWHALGVAIWLVALLALTLIPSGRADGSNDARAGSGVDDARAAQLERGHAVYAFHCTTCHGATGQGFEEARSVFPDDHYHCIRCHAPANPPVMTQAEIDRTQSVFSLGNAPGLADAEALARFGSAAGLHGYVRATMPRWNPGSLDDDEFLDVTAFVLHLAGLLPDDVSPLTHEGLATVALAAAAD